MKRLGTFLASMVLSATLVYGCSSGYNPMTPDPVLSLNTENAAQTHLWGYFDIAIDTESQKVEVIQKRHTMFTTNVTNFLNSNPFALQFSINDSRRYDRLRQTAIL